MWARVDELDDEVRIPSFSSSSSSLTCSLPLSHFHTSRLESVCFLFCVEDHRHRSLRLKLGPTLTSESENTPPFSLSVRVDLHTHTHIFCGT